MNWLESLGLTLLHFVWQGLLIGLIAALINTALKKSSANVRYVAACCALAMMGVAVVGTFLWITRPASAGYGVATSAAGARSLAVAAVIGDAPSQSWTQLLPWLDFLWFAGVCALAVRSVVSWFAAMRLTRSGVIVAPEEWQHRAARLMQRLAIAKPVRLCESMIAEVPSVIGWLRPVILIPAGTLAGLSVDQLETILAHELAHVRRHDYLINLLQTAIETLLFYHPAVWWVGNRIRMERENCCDDLAVEVCGDAFLYARALANLEQLRHTGPRLALAATDGGLLSRIARLLGHRAEQTGTDTRSYWLPALLMVVLAAAAVVAQQGVPPAAPVPVPARVVEPAPAPAPEPPTPPGSSESPEAPPQVNAPAPPKEDFIETMDRAGMKGLSVDQLVALKIHGVTPEYIQQTKAMGLSLNVDQLTAFRIHGVTPEYMNEWKTRGWTLTPDQLIAFRIHGVTAQAIDQMRALGFAVSADEAVATRIHNVTPEFVKTWKDAGFANVKFDELMALRIHNVGPAMIQELRSLGFQNPSLDQLVQARIFNITPAFVASVRKRGFDKLTFDQLVQLKQMDIVR